ncbi:hypothetical protein UK23_42535 [Lentzea aerocolonigenes]|uniref:SpoVT-AbrB domain-containing protein n=1 Tax=Lentzea aerocolonigenes TaxID=68170 RepID=A0A0F0GDH0_LENAE|nr:hypothetical protein [Lentzea aerocolonigenes]KJK35949.1 hypothetical protein UK23_42535 [Lentzea aerocolonigenes]
MTEAAVPLFVPPPPPAQLESPTDLLPLQQIPVAGPISPLAMTIAKVDHSGRIPALDVITSLNWTVGDHTHVSTSADAIIIRRATSGQSASTIDCRRQLFIPSGARTQFGLQASDRLLLVAAPRSAILRLHPITVVTSILTAYYSTQRDL